MKTPALAELHFPAFNGLHQSQYRLMNLSDGMSECIITFAAWIIQIPALDMLPRQDGAAHFAAHFDNNIDGRKFVQQLALLRLLHINAIDLLHQPQGILVDLRLGLRSGAIAVKHIRCQVFSQRLGNLAAAGIMHADKGSFGFLYPIHQN